MSNLHIVPPRSAIDAAIAAARQSPCSKSKRGAAVFHPATTTVFGVGFNGQPGVFACTGSELCRQNCGKLCVHAESRALRHANAKHWTGDLFGLEMLHVKVVDGMLVPSGSPSCWQCSREVVDSRLSAMWLYLSVPSTSDMVPPSDEWRRYTAADFHQQTLTNCGIGV